MCLDLSFMLLLTGAFLLETFCIAIYGRAIARLVSLIKINFILRHITSQIYSAERQIFFLSVQPSYNFQSISKDIFFSKIKHLKYNRDNNHIFLCRRNRLYIVLAYILFIFERAILT